MSILAPLRICIAVLDAADDTDDAAVLDALEPAPEPELTKQIKDIQNIQHKFNTPP